MTVIHRQCAAGSTWPIHLRRFIAADSTWPPECSAHCPSGVLPSKCLIKQLMNSIYLITKPESATRLSRTRLIVG